MVYGRTSLYVGGVESKRVKKAGLRGGEGENPKRYKYMSTLVEEYIQ